MHFQIEKEQEKILKSSVGAVCLFVWLGLAFYVGNLYVKQWREFILKQGIPHPASSNVQ